MKTIEPTESAEMGKVITKLELQNWDDIAAVAAGYRQESPREVSVEALVDTGATSLYLQKSVIRKLGLRPIRQIQSRTMSDRLEPRHVYSPVNLKIEGRELNIDVIEIPDTLPNLVGQVPLELLDFVVDMRRHKLVQNPDHPDGPMMDEF